MQNRYVHGANTDELLVKVDGNGAVYYHHDALGNTTYLSNSSGQMVESYRYDVFGRAKFFSGAGTVLGASAYDNRFLFTGREWLPGVYLYDYRNRMYSPKLGRFAQNDPIRFESKDVNLYRYVCNNALNKIDPDGLLGLPQDSGGIAYVYCVNGQKIAANNPPEIGDDCHTKCRNKWQGKYIDCYSCNGNQVVFDSARAAEITRQMAGYGDRLCCNE